MPKVLISDKMSARATEVFKQRGIAVDVRTELKPAELKGAIAAYDGLVVRSSTTVTADIVESAANLKVIGRAGIGVDNIDVAAATKRGVVVMNTPFGNAITTAEHAIAMMFALARQIPAADRSTQEGKWEKSRFIGVELTGKVLGIVGCGNIGSIVADRAIGLKMKVIAFDPFLSAERARDLGVERVDLDDLFARADFITLHTPLTESTRGIVDAAAIKKMKKGVHIVNCARGGLVVETDLRAALDSGQVAGAGFDVFSVEPAKENPLFGAPNFVATPHLGASTREAQENVAVEIAQQISDFLLDGAIVNAVNMPSISGDEAAKLAPYMTLAEQLGSFIGQLAESAVTKVVISYEGLAAEINHRPLTAILLKGLLAPQLEAVNVVSAPLAARERNIEVVEMKSDRPTDYQTAIRLTVTENGGARTIGGTLFGGVKPRIIEIDGMPIEAELGSNVLYVRNVDKPGVVGRLGSCLGDAGYNIATFQLGRSGPGGGSLALVHVDQPISDKVIELVRAQPNVIRVKALSF